MTFVIEFNFEAPQKAKNLICISPWWII